MSSTVDTPERVLIVDDEEGIRNALQRVVTKGGYEAYVASDAVDGLAQAAKLDPSVIILDLRMPKMDGHTFLRRLEASGLDCAVIVSSANGEMDDLIEVMRHGAIDYVKKPWTTSEVLSAIARAVDIRGNRRLARGTSMVPVPVVSVVPAVPAVTSPAETFPQILERIQRGEILLPSVPSIIQELRALVLDREVPIDRVTQLVERDQALAARVLQLGRGRTEGKPRIDLRESIAHLGFQRIHALVETIWVSGCFQSRDPRFVPFSQQLARFGLARAVAMRTFATAAKLDGSIAYFGGLFADVGAAFLLYVIVEKASGEAPDPVAALAFVREQHEAIGAQLLTQWGYTGDVTNRARHHHAATAATRKDPYAKLCLLATAATHELAGDVDLTGEAPTPGEADQCARELGIDSETRARCIDAAIVELSAVTELL